MGILYDPSTDKTTTLRDDDFVSIFPTEFYSNPIKIKPDTVFFYGSFRKFGGLGCFFYNLQENELIISKFPETSDILLAGTPQAILLQDGFIQTGVSEANQAVFLFDEKTHKKNDEYITLMDVNGYKLELAPVPQNSPVVALDKTHILYGNYLSSKLKDGTWRRQYLANHMLFENYDRYSVLKNGNILFLGGRKRTLTSCTERLAQRTEIYLKDKKMFIPGPNMLTPRRSFEVTALDNGDLLISGGLTESCQFPYLRPSNSIEIYKP